MKLRQLAHRFRCLKSCVTLFVCFAVKSAIFPLRLTTPVAECFSFDDNKFWEQNISVTLTPCGIKEKRLYIVTLTYFSLNLDYVAVHVMRLLLRSQ